jgi:hypothetical protein
LASAATAAASVWVLVGCGGGGDAGSNSGLVASSSVAQHCAAPRSSDVLGTVADEKSWVRSWTDETYLWYQDVRNLGASTLNADNYLTALAYFNALKSPLTTASGAPKDQFHFTYDTPAWVALSQSGVSYGYGFEVDLVASRPPRKAVVVYTDPNIPTASDSPTRGAQVLKVDGVDFVNDNTDEGVARLNAGLFPVAAGSHTLTVLDIGASTPRDVSLTAKSVISTPVQNVKTLPAPYQTVGYMQFNDHIATAESQLIAGINQLKTAGVTDLVLDIRYNGGGYLDIAAELAAMIADPALTNGKVFEVQTFNDKNPFQLTLAQRTTPFFATSQGFSGASGQTLPNLGLNRVYVLAGPGTCSASEAVVNGLRGAGVTVSLIGGTTCGKPYGFYPQDNCNTTYFAIQFQGVNQLGFGDYADGFAPTCTVADDYNHALGDPAEGRLAAALYLRANGVCQPGTGVTANAVRTRTRTPGADEIALTRPVLRENRFYRAH